MLNLNSMGCLPDQLVWEILTRVKKIEDRNSLSLTCKRIYNLDNQDRKIIKVDPTNEALLAICTRFQNLEKVEIGYYGRTSRLGKQLDDQGLKVLSRNCPSLKDLTLSYCTFITDAGLFALSCCSKLSALKLESMHKISGCGILCLFINCKKLISLHLIRCLNVSSDEWLAYVGRLRTLEDLCIIDCKSISEGDLIKLGAGWQKLKKLQFEVDMNYRYMEYHVKDQWQEQWVPCDNMTELSLVNCIVKPGRGLTCVLGKCKNLEKVHFDMCVELRDSDVLCLARKSRNLRSLSLRIPLDFSLPVLRNIPNKLTDESMKVLSENCTKLESIRLSLSEKSSSITSNGIIMLIQKCPVRELALDRVDAFNDAVMKVLCGAKHLEMLELVRCQEVTDEGLQLISQFPRLKVLRLSKCLGLTNDGLRPLIGTLKLNLLDVEDCPRITEREIQGAANTLSFRQFWDPQVNLQTVSSVLGDGQEYPDDTFY